MKKETIEYLYTIVFIKTCITYIFTQVENLQRTGNIGVSLHFSSHSNIELYLFVFMSVP